MSTATPRDVKGDRDATNTSGQARRPWMANVPGLRIFVPPTAPTSAADDPASQAAARAGEVVPWSLPGSKLRASERSARRGWYAPAHAGAPSTTRQARILNTALIALPTGHEGIVNGRDVLSRSIVSHDAATAYNAKPRLITSPNTLVMGDVGTGKSTMVKCVGVARSLLLARRRALVFDKKDEGGAGEYTQLAEFYGSSPLRFDPDGSGTRLNMLDPTILRGDGLQGVYRLLNTIVRTARDDQPLTEWEEEALRTALRRLYAAAEADGHRAPVTADLLPHLAAAADDPAYADLHPSARELLHHAGLTVRWVLTGLLHEYGGVLDGETSRDVDLSHKLTVFDLSQLPSDGPAVPVVMALGHMWLNGRLRRDRGWITTVVYEEGWHMIEGSGAQLVKANQKLSRGLGIANWFVMHKGSDIPTSSPGYTVVQEAKTVYVFGLERPKEAAWATQTFGLAPETAATITRLPMGQCVMKRGGAPEVQVQVVRSRWEAAITNTDTAMSAAVAAGIQPPPST